MSEELLKQIIIASKSVYFTYEHPKQHDSLMIRFERYWNFFRKNNPSFNASTINEMASEALNQEDGK